MSANTETAGADRAKCHPACGKAYDEYLRSEYRVMFFDGYIRADRDGHVYCSQACAAPPIAAPAAHIERRKGQRWKYVESGEELVLATKFADPNDGREAWEDVTGRRWFGWCWPDWFALLADATPEPAKDHVSKCQEMCAAGTCKDCDREFAESSKSPTVQEAPKQWKEHARCGFPIVSSNREAAVTAVGKHQATCEKCSAQEAPKAAPVWLDCQGCHVRSAGVILRVTRKGRAGLCDACMRGEEVTVWSLMAFESTGTPYAGPERLPRPQLAADWVEDCLEDA